MERSEVISRSFKNIPQMRPIVATLKQAMGDNLMAIVLFGSRARGDADEMSDWDLFVITQYLPQKSFQRHLYLKKLLPDLWRGQVAIIAKTPAEFEAYLPSLYLDIALDGIILYDTNNYITEHLAWLKRLIRQKGLHREQVGNEFIWHWQKFPGLNWTLEWEAVR
jgi:predicted nucleotidyltransferase